MKQFGVETTRAMWAMLVVGSLCTSGCGDQHKYGVGQDGSEDFYNHSKAVEDEERERHHQLRQKQSPARRLAQGE